MDFKAMGERASRIEIAHSDLRQVGMQRRSSRSGQVHSIGGFVGTVEYEGKLAEFFPYIEAAGFTGVGRHCAWGNGEVAILKS